MNEFNRVPEYIELKEEGIKSLIFDMDGTLLNSEVLHEKALIELLGEKSKPTRELLDLFVGVAEPYVHKTLLTKGIIDAISFVDFVKLKNEKFVEYLKDEDVFNQVLNPSVIKLIADARADGLKIALVTASEKDTTEIFLNSLNLKGIFDLILTREDTKKTKPHPMPYLEAFKRLGMTDKECIIFEDSIIGLQAAKESKAKFFKVSWYY
jgi:beta-phosphoglucomutase